MVNVLKVHARLLLHTVKCNLPALSPSTHAYSASCALHYWWKVSPDIRILRFPNTAQWSSACSGILDSTGTGDQCLHKALEAMIFFVWSPLDYRVFVGSSTWSAQVDIFWETCHIEPSGFDQSGEGYIHIVSVPSLWRTQERTGGCWDNTEPEQCLWEVCHHTFECLDWAPILVCFWASLLLKGH